MGSSPSLHTQMGGKIPSNLLGGDESWADGVSADGRVVVGWAHDQPAIPARILPYTV